jgi:Raf kinase inhibitor-like YbhB/YbcL family protein
MLEHVPHWLGELLSNVRAGHGKLTIAQLGGTSGTPHIALSSPAFAAGARLPERFTADGAGVSPPLVWGEVPSGTASLALLVEDPDAPTPNPLVHALVWHLPPETRSLAENAIRHEGAGAEDGRDIGLNSFFAEGWLPPDPPTGHGSHDYVFQLFALSETPALGLRPGRIDLVKALQGHVLGAGVLIGTYSREEPAASGPAFAWPSPVTD